MVVGEGRSGTSWLLQLLDTSRRTHCRNEPDTIAECSPFTKLPKPLILTEDLAAALDRDWDGAVHETATRIGRRDFPVPVRKDHLHGFAQRAGLVRAINRRPRRILSKLMPSLRGGEFNLPSWIGSRARLEAAVPVLKMIQIPAWTAWVLAHRPGARVAHIVRHPGGFLNSWRNRHVSKHNETFVRAENRKRLDEIRQRFPAWSDRFGDIDAMSVVESELWYWRYATETINAAGAGRSNYHLVLYEHLAADPPGVARRIFDFAELEWTSDVEHRIRATSNESEALAAAWRSKLSTDDVAAIERVMTGSVMERWWG